MNAQWLGLRDRRSGWVFIAAILCMVACLLLAAFGPLARRMDFILAAGCIGGIGAAWLNRSARSGGKTLPEIYEDRVRGDRMTFAVKLLSLLCIGLVAIAFVTQFGQ